MRQTLKYTLFIIYLALQRMSIVYDSNDCLDFLGIVKGGRSNTMLSVSDLNEKNYILSGDQKTLICMGLNGELDNLSDWAALGVKSCVSFANMFNVSSRRVNKWLARYRSGEKLYDTDHTGQPVKVDGDTHEAIKEAIKMVPTGKRTNKEIKKIINRFSKSVSNHYLQWMVLSPVKSITIVIRYVCMTSTQYLVEIYNTEHLVAGQNIQQHSTILLRNV